MLQKLTHRISHPRRRAATSLPTARAKAAGASVAEVDGMSVLSGVGGGWNRPEYGEYYATSTPVYSAIRIRAEALTRPPVVVYRRTGSESGAQRASPSARNTRPSGFWSGSTAGTPAPTSGAPPRST